MSFCGKAPYFLRELWFSSQARGGRNLHSEQVQISYGYEVQGNTNLHLVTGASPQTPISLTLTLTGYTKPNPGFARSVQVIASSMKRKWSQRKGKRSYGAARSSKRRKRNAAKRKPSGYGSIVNMRTVQPQAIFVKMQLSFTKLRQITALGATITGANIALNRLRDPDLDTDTSVPYVSQFLDYARMYSRYKVYSMTMACQITSTVAAGVDPENNTFYSIAYSIPVDDGTGDPTVDPYTPATLRQINGVLQDKSIRRKFIVPSAVDQRGGIQYHKTGNWSMKRIQRSPVYDSEDYCGYVNTTGGSHADPQQRPRVIHRLMREKLNSNESVVDIAIRYFLTFNVKWDMRRRDLATVLGDTGPDP